jgi:phosphoserine phosphatase
MRSIVESFAASPGHSTPRADPVLVLDLDGTVLRMNSFPIWVMFLASRSMSSGVRVMRLVIERKRGRIDHEELLRRMQALWAWHAGPHDEARLQSLLMWLVRRNLRSILRHCADGKWDAVLATAAAADYAEGLSHRLGMRYVLATPAERRPDELSNSGERKLRRVIEWLHERGWQGRPLIFFNDHMADLPLMREARIVCWFGSRRSLEEARRQTTARIIACRGMRGPQMQTTLAQLYNVVIAERLSDRLPSRMSTAA